MSEANEMSALEAMMVELGDIDLFPDRVLELYKSGPSGPRRARAAARRVRKAEKNPERKKLQGRIIDELRMWATPAKAPSLYTLNGIGTTLYGQAQKRDDGTYIATQWLAFVFLPIIPLGSYWVKPADNGGWYFIASTPNPGWVKTPPLIWGGLIAAAVLFAMIGSWNASSSAEVVLFNGYADTVQITTDDGESWTLPPEAHRITTLSAEPIVFSAAFEGKPPFETVEIDLSDRAWETTVYNPGAEGLVFVDKIIYGMTWGDPPAPDFLIGRESVTDDIDYYFTEAPEEISSSASTVTKYVLDATGSQGSPFIIALSLQSAGEPEAARRYIWGKLETGLPADAMIIQMGMSMEMDNGATLATVCERLIDAAPEDVERHRVCQSRRQMEGDTTVVDEYRARAEANPESGLDAYLLGRLLEGEESVAAFRRAVQLDPDLHRAQLALASSLMSTDGASDEVEAAVRKAMESDSPELQSDAKTLLAHVLRYRDAEPAAFAELNQEAAVTYELLASVEQNPSSLESAQQVVEATFADGTGGEFGAMMRPALLGELALAAGDIDALRQANAEGAGMELMLALSKGATNTEKSWTPLPESTIDDPAYAVFLWDLHSMHGDDQLATSALAPLRTFISHTADFLVENARTDVESLEAALAGAPPAVQSAAWFAYARRTGDREMARRARQWGLPGEFPIF